MATATSIHQQTDSDFSHIKGAQILQFIVWGQPWQDVSAVWRSSNLTTCASVSRWKCQSDPCFNQSWLVFWLLVIKLWAMRLLCQSNPPWSVTIKIFDFSKCFDGWTHTPPWGRSKEAHQHDALHVSVDPFHTWPPQTPQIPPTLSSSISRYHFHRESPSEIMSGALSLSWVKTQQPRFHLSSSPTMDTWSTFWTKCSATVKWKWKNACCSKGYHKKRWGGWSHVWCF